MQTRKIKVVLDTNVLVAAIVFDGNPRQIIKLAAQKKIVVFISPFIIEEIIRVLSKKFHFEKERLGQVQERIEKSTTLVVPLRKFNIIKTDKTDNKILEAAVEAKVDYLVSGDKKHLLTLRKFRNILILSPKEFLTLLTL